MNNFKYLFFFLLLSVAEAKPLSLELKHQIRFVGQMDLKFIVSDEKVWMGGDSCVYSYAIKDEKWEEHLSSVKFSYRVTVLKSFGDWVFVGTQSNGLLCVNVKTNNIKQFTTQDHLFSMNIEDMLIIEDRLWLAQIKRQKGKEQYPLSNIRYLDLKTWEIAGIDSKEFTNKVHRRLATGYYPMSLSLVRTGIHSFILNNGHVMRHYDISKEKWSLVATSPCMYPSETIATQSHIFVSHALRRQYGGGIPPASLNTYKKVDLYNALRANKNEISRRGLDPAYGKTVFGICAEPNEPSVIWATGIGRVVLSDIQYGTKQLELKVAGDAKNPLRANNFLWFNVGDMIYAYEIHGTYPKVIIKNRKY